MANLLKAAHLKKNSELTTPKTGSSGYEVAQQSFQ